MAGDRRGCRRLTLPVHDRRSVRSSSGHAEDRIVVLMRLTLARRRITAEVTSPTVTNGLSDARGSAGP
ncbi:MAG: hypothetical protein IPM00_09860 [Tetrasphaera sp.]|nr:hypothetical protein [Tetrasphaera sp.]